MSPVPPLGKGLPALLLALLAIAIGPMGAHAGSGGIGAGGGGDSGGGGCRSLQFGERSLERGDCGSDVRTLNWILRAKSYGVALDPDFERPTDDSVRHFQRKRDLAVTGVVNTRTRDEIVASMNHPLASWYGPGFWGNKTACGQTLRRDTVGVAHRSLPCGTKVVIGYGGRFLRTRVIDRGPYVKRRYTRDWDLTQAAAERLRFEGTARVRSAAID